MPKPANKFLKIDTPKSYLFVRNPTINIGLQSIKLALCMQQWKISTLINLLNQHNNSYTNLISNIARGVILNFISVGTYLRI
jgi:hypothetical protein